MAMVVQPAPRRLFTALGFADLGPVPNYVKLLRPARVLTQLESESLPLPAARIARPALRLAQRSGLAAVAGTTLDLGARLWSRLAGSTRAYSASAAAPLNASVVDDLWQRARAGIAAAPARDGAFLVQRYEPRDGYRAALVRDAQAPAALAIVRAPRAESDPRLRGLRVATLSDLIVAPDRPRAAVAAIAAAEALARELDADALLCSASHASLRGPLLRRAFVPVGGNVHFMLRDPAAGTPPFPPDLHAWWITRGDSNADEIF
jgi:hypothetical protein